MSMNRIGCIHACFLLYLESVSLPLKKGASVDKVPVAKPSLGTLTSVNSATSLNKVATTSTLTMTGASHHQSTKEATAKTGTGATVKASALKAPVIVDNGSLFADIFSMSTTTKKSTSVSSKAMDSQCLFFVQQISGPHGALIVLLFY